MSDASPESSSPEQAETAPALIVEATETSPVSPSDYKDSIARLKDKYGEDLHELIDGILSPISDESPCGDNPDAGDSVISGITTSSYLDAIRDGFGDAVRARKSEVDREANSQEDGSGSQANTNNVKLAFDIKDIAGSEAEELLESVVACFQDQCKSLLVACYLPQLMKTCFGIRGFAAGLDLMAELTHSYGEKLHPLDMTRMQNFLLKGPHEASNNNMVFNLFKFQPITKPVHEELGTIDGPCLPHCLYKIQQSLEGTYNYAASKTQPEFYRDLLRDLDLVLDSIQTTNQIINEFLGPPENRTIVEQHVVRFNFTTSIQEMRNDVNKLAQEHCPGFVVEEIEEVVANESTTSASGSAEPLAAGEIASRDQAIKLLQKIADFFYKTEPHSPVSYSIKQSIRWTKMNLPELLEELLNGEPQPLSELARRVGFRDGGEKTVGETNSEG